MPQRLRDERIAAGEPFAWRLDMQAALAFAGPVAGWQETGAGPGGETGLVPAEPELWGDVVLARKDAPTSYHLAATLDDAEMGITHVMRGDDLRDATHIHRLLQALLNLPTPYYRFHPLLVDADGKRLAKRSGSIALADLRDAGTDPAQLRDDLRAGRFPVGIRAASA